MYIEQIKLTKVNKPTTTEFNIYLINQPKDLLNLDLKTKRWLVEKVINQKSSICIETALQTDIYYYIDKSMDADSLESQRKMGNAIFHQIDNHKIVNATFNCSENIKSGGKAVLEGLLLSAYRFDKYLSHKKPIRLRSIKVNTPNLSPRQLQNLKSLVYSVHVARTLVNEPLSYLTADQLSKEFKTYARGTGIKVQVLEKKEISKLGMGGILAVNKGSILPPTFTIMEYKPTKPINKNPIILVGKGIVYDTGGLSLKPTPASMDRMKSDMSGGAVTFGTLLAVALHQLPLHVITLVPATENRPGQEAYTPGDIITMYDGTTVEVLNTDAEGRLVLADTLAYAKKYKPKLVLDFATLTGAASAAIGSAGIVCMGTADEHTKKLLKESGNQTYERLVELPLWQEYGDMIKSPIADLKNIGDATGGAISAGKFLEHFTDYPWIHFDIAGVSYTTSELSYRGLGGTGMGIRMAFEYLNNLSTNNN